MSESTGVCSICSCESTEPGKVIIHDYKKWLFSPVPCPECWEKAKKTISRIVAESAAERERQVFDKLLK